ncbi:MAG TPA: hypothetical protein VG713_08540 [Pirellulales bacterium]|nr:hypothetical protein [Pirellulales bacterium]
MSRGRAFNPFYAVVVMASIAFCVTACAYGVMTMRELKNAVGQAEAESPLMQFMDEHGGRLLGSEVAILGLAAIAAMATDRYWHQRHAAGDQ